MDALALRQPRRFAARASLVAVVSVAVAVATYGAWLIPGMLGSERPQPASLGALQHKAIFAIGDRAPLSFGALSVLDARVTSGLTNQQIGGMTHGVSGLIDARSGQLQVSMAMTNSRYAAARWSAADFRLEAARSGRQFAPVGGTSESGSLAPGASLDLVLNFVVPRNGDHFTLRVRDGNKFVRVHLIQVGKAPPGTKGFDHAHATSVAVPKQREVIKQ
ncbi:MAG: hypothetical protein QOK36_676 [Gaiellales bacterium]|nr:hypothetical protein [Gaiellales bacterium]